MVINPIFGLAGSYKNRLCLCGETKKTNKRNKNLEAKKITLSKIPFKCRSFIDISISTLLLHDRRTLFTMRVILLQDLFNVVGDIEQILLGVVVV